ncbi:hypothetical protein NGRA_0854 [Nosema granulosis]|uniref:Uncharacterized protein n=1 Tax=Nosema granulosis TaxID=83296 RepID=A0A9P6H2S7_9MICR|nr:hypothetical protein NGRA_0854 [Nosema granulosis]
MINLNRFCCMMCLKSRILLRNSPVDVLNSRNLASTISEEVVEDNVFIKNDYIKSRDEARISTQRSADRLVARSICRNDYLEFQLGSRVSIRSIHTTMLNPEV